MSQGKHPRVLMKDALRTKSLILRLTKSEGGGQMHIHGIPPEADDIQHWIQNLDLKNLEYRGEGLPNISQKVLLQLAKHNKEERIYLTGEEKATLFDEFDFRCAICKQKSTTFEWDHITRLAEAWNQQRFQPLCPSCHVEKQA